MVPLHSYWMRSCWHSMPTSCVRSFCQDLPQEDRQGCLDCLINESTVLVVERLDGSENSDAFSKDESTSSQLKLDNAIIMFAMYIYESTISSTNGCQ